MKTASRACLLTGGLILLGWGAMSLSKTPAAQADASGGTEASQTEQQPQVEPQEPLVVHEWGTFTSFSGSDGIRLEYRPLVDQDLPPFVIRNEMITQLWLGKYELSAFQRMETPVTYFYTPVERDVKVRVNFPQGLLTEFYPPVFKYAPMPERKEGESPFLQTGQPDENAIFKGDWKNSGLAKSGTDGTDEAGQVELKDSYLDWGTVHLIPPEKLRAHVDDEKLSRKIGKFVEKTMVPQTSLPHYAAARATDSAIVQYSPARNQDPDAKAAYTPLPGTDSFEKFLFYRGVGNFELPLTMEAKGDGAFEVHNAGDEPVQSLFLVTVNDDGISYSYQDSVPANASATLHQATAVKDRSALEKSVAEQLVRQGLYEKEALAMVATWRDSWFTEAGTRLFYVVPRSLTDKLLPLTVEPTPDETVRVLVGRLETMPPETEQHLLEIVQQSHAARASHDPRKNGKFQSPVMAELQALGRLAEPALVRVAAVSGDPDIQLEVRTLRKELRADKSL